MTFCEKLGQEIGFVGVKYMFKFYNVKNIKFKTQNFAKPVIYAG